MNCTQAKALIAIYRELKPGEADTIELERHLEQCETCRGYLARSSSIGASIRVLPKIQPDPAMHARLMQTLAAEHARFLQKPGATTPPPEFLKPYLHEHAQQARYKDQFAALSTAETGPLPVIKMARKRQRRAINQYAILGLAASILIVFMMGGLTSLLMLTNGNIQRQTSISNSVVQPASVIKASYTTSTSYTHVVSSIGDQSALYYTAYNNETPAQWMLFKMDRKTRISTPLLDKPSSTPIRVEASDGKHLIWLQWHEKTPGMNKSLPGKEESGFQTRTWDLNNLALLDENFTSQTLLSGTFHQDLSPDWVSDPVQGLIFSTPGTLLLTALDDKGISHLWSYQLTDQHPTKTRVELATAPHGRLLTSPTASSDGRQIYWSEEWNGKDQLHSNIWSQQVTEAQAPAQGIWQQHLVTEKQLFRDDGMSFQPVLTENAIYWLSTAPINKALGTPTPTTAPTTIPATPTPLPTVEATLSQRFDHQVYTPSQDQLIRGTLLYYPLNGQPDAVPTIQQTRGLISNLRGNKDFVLCHDDNGYQMFDGTNGNPITVGGTLDRANFFAINGSNVSWAEENALPDQTPSPTPTSESSNNNDPIPSVTILEFNWPLY